MGIKNFKAQHVGEVNAKAEKITIAECMTKSVVKITEGQSIIKAVELILKHRVSGLPVVDASGRLIGIISEGDCIKQISDSRYYNLPMELTKVEKYMSANLETMTPEVNLFDAAQRFISTKRRRFPVVDQGKLVGVVSQKDVLRTALLLKGYNWKN
jgi:CBS domain-containing protein